jgi:hypothetical protein
MMYQSSRLRNGGSRSDPHPHVRPFTTLSNELTAEDSQLSSFASEVISTACSCIVTSPTPVTVYSTVIATLDVLDLIQVTNFITSSVTATTTLAPTATYVLSNLVNGQGGAAWGANGEVQGAPVSDFDITECLDSCISVVDGSWPIQGLFLAAGASGNYICDWYIVFGAWH